MFKDSNNDAGAIHIYILLKYKLYGLILLCIYVICISVGNQTYIFIDLIKFSLNYRYHLLGVTFP